MCRDRLGREHKLLGDLPVGQACRDELGDLEPALALAAAAASRSSMRVRKESRPTRTGDWITPRALTTHHPGPKYRPRPEIKAPDACDSGT